jgi:hypothetical protein
MNLTGWVLVLFAHVGPMGDGNSNALTTALFSSQHTCEEAGKAAKNLSFGSTKRITYVCVKQ